MPNRKITARLDQMRRRFDVREILLAILWALAFTCVPARAQTLSTIYSFTGGNAGNAPGSLITGPNGSFIGTAVYGSNCPCYLTFSISAQGKETVLHRFSVPLGYEAEAPTGYVLSKDGATLYGLSSYGGDYTACPEGLGCGFVFSVDLTTNKYKVLHEFHGSPNDGAEPTGNLVIDSGGNIYGMAFDGGTNSTGAIFKITPAGSESLLYSFRVAPDGNYPAGGLAINSAGVLFGATISGGNGPSNNGVIGSGTVFKVTPTGKETILYNFQNGADGLYPYWLVKDPEGNLYGVSRNLDNAVIAVFKVSPTGQFSIFYNGSYVSQITTVNAGPKDTIDATATGGADDDGEVIQLNSDGSATVLQTFDGIDGSLVQFGLVKDNGAIYGTTAQGGAANDGTIFKLIP